MQLDSSHPSKAYRARQWCYRGLILLVLSLTSACARKTPTSPAEAFRETSPPPLYDDLQFEGLDQAIRNQLSVFRRTEDKVMQFGTISITRGAYEKALRDLLHCLDHCKSIQEKTKYIEDNFRFFEFFGSNRWGEVLLTSYFEPVLQASKAPTKRYPQALYSKPSDLVTIQLASFSTRFTQESPLKGRLRRDKVIPYFTRGEIDGEGKLRGKQLELAWVDPIDAFFLHIQGSGTVRYDDGTEEHLVYADKNGHRYVPIGKFLKDKIAPKPVTMQSIEQQLHIMTERERNNLLFQNPSYVFFSKSQQRAITALGIPATPGRTIAVDPKLAPKGAITFIQFRAPHFPKTDDPESSPDDFIPSSRFAMDQDSGGAITGTGRVDLFWGRGPDAKRHAGVMQHPARILYLLPITKPVTKE